MDDPKDITETTPLRAEERHRKRHKKHHKRHKKEKKERQPKERRPSIEFVAMVPTKPLKPGWVTTLSIWRVIFGATIVALISGTPNAFDAIQKVRNQACPLPFHPCNQRCAV
jgi:hypothetical protein